MDALPEKPHRRKSSTQTPHEWRSGLELATWTTVSSKRSGSVPPTSNACTSKPWPRMATAPPRPEKSPNGSDNHPAILRPYAQGSSPKASSTRPNTDPFSSPSRGWRPSLHGKQRTDPKFDQDAMHGPAGAYWQARGISVLESYRAHRLPKLPRRLDNPGAIQQSLLKPDGAHSLQPISDRHRQSDRLQFDERIETLWAEFPAQTTKLHSAHRSTEPSGIAV